MMVGINQWLPRSNVPYRSAAMFRIALISCRGITEYCVLKSSDSRVANSPICNMHIETAFYKSRQVQDSQRIC